MDLEQKHIAYMVAAGVVLAVILVLGLRYRTQSPAPQSLNQEVAEATLQRQVASIVETRDFNQCNQVSDRTYQTVCVNNIALALARENEEVSFCQKTDNQLVLVVECERQVILKKAIERNDVDICQETKNAALRLECAYDFWYSAALKDNSVSLCNNIGDAAHRDNCHDQYLFNTAFSQNPKDFDCSKFVLPQVQIQCNELKKWTPQPTS